MSPALRYVAVLPAALLVGACHEPPPGPPGDPGRAETLETLAEAMAQVQRHYVEPGTAGRDLLVRLAVEGMVGELDELSAVLVGPAGSLVPQDLWRPIPSWGCVLGPDRGKVRVLSVFPGGPFAEADIEPGMELAFVGDQPVTASRVLDRGGWAVTGETAVVAGWDERFFRRIIPGTDSGMPGFEARFLEAGLVAVTLRWLEPDTAVRLRHVLSASPAAGVILDLRGAASLRESDAVDVASLFLPARSDMWWTKSRDGVEGPVRTRGRPVFAEGPMAVLIDRHTAGTPELIAASLTRREGAVLLGSPTAGRAVRLGRFPVEGDLVLYLGQARYVDADGMAIAEDGVIPDVAWSNPDRDTMIDEAVRIIQGQP